MRIHPAFVLVLVVGCGTDESPVDKCDDLVDTLCDRGVQCLGGAHTDCVQTFQQALSCGAAKDVSSSYDRCIAQLEADSCALLFPTDPQTGDPSLDLPADCMGVILVREAPAPGPASSWLRDAARLWRE
jgi:hypothetical protein